MGTDRNLVSKLRTVQPWLAGTRMQIHAALRRKREKILFPLLFLVLLVAPSATAQQAASEPPPASSSAITEVELKQLLLGKFLYLRGRYLDDSLSFNERGNLLSNSPQGSYTLSVVRIDSLRLTRHKLELRGLRYGLHFLGAISSQASANAVDHVRITPRKKWVRIAIARMKVVKPPKKRKGAAVAPAPPLPGATITTSPAFAATVLRKAIDNVFASSLDARMLAAMPDFWRLYYQETSAETGVQPAQPAVFRISDVDAKPGLLGHIDAASNQYAQSCGIAGVALYRAEVGADGAPDEVVITRPIGFGLDENAVAAIRSARFSPAIKDGKPVPVLVDLAVEFRIYSKRTANALPPVAGTPSAVPLPGPYSASHQ